MGIDQLSNCTIACGFFSFFSCPYKKRTRFSFPKEKNMSFSHRRENDEKSRRDFRLGLSCFCWEAYTHGSKGVAVLAKLAQATTRRAKSSCGWKLRARRRKLPDCTRRPFGVFRRGLHEFTECKHVPGADEMRFRLAQTVKPEACSSFDAFLSVKKSMLLSFPKETGRLLCIPSRFIL